MSLPIGEIICGDCLDVMRGFPDNSVDCCICDPPYGLSFMGKKWDYDVPSVAIWREVYRVLKDGGRLLAFAGARTQHRMVCNIEDAGFCIEDCMMWLYGSGFPKHKSKLKPAYEPICVARKGKVSLLNIDAARIGDSKSVPASVSRKVPGNCYGRFAESGETQGVGGHDPNLGRWPANIVLDEEAAAMLDEQSGTLTSGTGAVKRASSTGWQGNAYGKENRQPGTPNIEYGDSGGASRFFYCAKASRSEREAGLSGLPVRQFGYSGGANNAIKAGENYDAAQSIGLNRVQTAHNDHPTVKPIDLMRWLVRLTTFPGEIILDPFAGSGTTGIAAAMEDRPFIGIELDADHCTKARLRIAHWSAIARKRTAQKGLPLE